MLVRLRGEFPEVSISKIRYLETEGLVEPARTPAGYRRFSEADVERLRYVLAAQRDHYLPLRVIKERLDRGLPRVTRVELIELSGIGEDALAELEAHRLIDPARGYDRGAVLLATTAAELAAYGMNIRQLAVRLRQVTRRLPGGGPAGAE